MGRVEGKVALITGAARGQGRSHAIRLAQEGADIIAIDACEDQPDMPYPGATEEQLAETHKLVEQTGRRIVALKADVRDVSGLQVAVARGVAELGRLDIVAANAALGMNPRQSEDIPEEAFLDMLNVDLVGVWRTTTAALPHIRAGERGGSIILTGSTASLRGLTNGAAYVAAKHGVMGLTRALAMELAPEMIRVNSIHPTQVNTDMLLNQTMFNLFRPELDNPTIEDFIPVSQSLNALPIPWVEPIDLSNALLFLASDEARYITGIALPVDAGSLLK